MSSELANDLIQIIVMAVVIAVILLCLGIGLLVIIHVCLVGRAFRGRRFEFGINTGTLDRSNSSHHISMSLDDIQKLPCYNYTTKDEGSCSSGSSSPVDCAVCLENFKVGEKCRQLPLCKHSFHAECVDSWLLRNPICPICRTIADSSKVVGLVLGDEERREDTHSDEVRDRQIGEGSNNVTNSGHESREHQLNLGFAIETIATTL